MPTPSPEPWRGDLGVEPELPVDIDEPLPLDPTYRTGRLENGMGWAVVVNDAPGGQARVRLVVDAGSIHDADGATGGAHFLEHMMFNGTERFPGNELIPVLEGFGAAFGPDVNAHTGYSETVYKLTVPVRQAADIQIGLDVLREWASFATLDPDAVIAERGVVHDEYRRRRETVAGRTSELTVHALLGDTIYAERPPIGVEADIESMAAEELRAFYETWYRPERMSVIVVGDIDPDDAIIRIQSTFADLQAGAEAPGPVEAEPGSPLPAPTYDVLVDPELTQTDTGVFWRLGSGPVITRRDVRDRLIAELGVDILSSRVERAAEAGEVGTWSASASAYSISPDHEVVEVYGFGDPGAVEPDLVDLIELVEQMRQHPIDPIDFALATDRIEAGVARAFEARDTRQDRDLATELSDWFLGGSTPLDPTVRRDATLEMLATIEPGDVRRFFDTLLSSPAYVLVRSPARTSDVLPDPAGLAAVADGVIGYPVDAADPAPTVPDRLLDRPDPVDEVDRYTIAELQTEVVSYPNGARLAFRPSRIAAGSVQFAAWSRGGFFLEEGPVVPLLGRTDEVVLPSGFESIDPIALDGFLADSSIALHGYIGRAEESLSGSTSAGDLETFFQLVHLAMTEPTIGEVQMRRFDAHWRPLAEDPAAVPELAADIALWRLRYGDSPYFRRAPTTADLDGIDASAQLEAWKRRFGNAGDFVFVFVGDVERSIVEELGRTYVATLPGSSERDAPVDRDPGVPAANLIETVEVGIGEQGRVRINWEAPFTFDQRSEIAARVLETVVDARLRDVVREQLGASYSPRATVVLLSEPKVWVDSIIEVTTDPDRVDEVSGTVRAELERIRAGDLDPGYVDRAVAQLVEQYQFTSNEQLVEQIRFYLAHPDRSPGELAQRASIARSLSVADIAEVARVVFPEGRSVEVRMVPAPPPPR